MGGGIKSKFKFPVPGRSSKKQPPPPVPVIPVTGRVVGTGSLSKAQRILGTDGLNIGSSRLTVGVDRYWESGSTGLSISDSNPSLSAHDGQFDRCDEGRTRWEEGSAGVPRMTRSTTDLEQKALRMQRSALTVGDESRDDRQKAAMRDRRLSSSTTDSHCDPKRMPVSTSQQTSNSMAKGLPMRTGEPLDAQPDKKKKKKKPARLDLSRLRPKGRDRNKNTPNTEPVVVVHGFIARNSPFMRKPTQEQQAARLSPHSKGISDSIALNKLYDQYEQMSFEEDEILGGDNGDEIDPTHHARPASTFNHSLMAPSPPRLRRERAKDWGHSRNSSRDSLTKATGSIADFSGGLHAQSAAKQDYAGSVSSRYTRTSKASNRSAVESDRLQHSILSLSDSSDDEGNGSSPSMPTSRGSLMYGGGLENSSLSRGQPSPVHSHGGTSQKKFMPSLHQLDEHLAVKSASGVHANRQPSNSLSPSNTLNHSNHSSMSTLTPSHTTPASTRGAQPSRPTDASSLQHHSCHGTQEAKRSAFASLAPAVEVNPEIPPSMAAHHPEKVALRRSSIATSRFSHSSGQPTPPLSPSSVEFYVKSRESLQRDALKAGSAETSNARLMAVTKQEEMLLAMLREKRARMRETTTGGETEEERRSRVSRAAQRSPAATSRARVTLRSPSLDSHISPTTTVWPVPEVERPKGMRRILENAHTLTATSRSEATAGSTTATALDARNDRFLLYLDQPNVDPIIGDSTLDLSDDYMDDSDGEDLVANERRTSRMQFRRSSTFSATTTTRGQSSSSSVGSRRGSGSQISMYRKDSLPVHSLNPPMKGYRLQDVPEVDPQQPEDLDVLDLDDLSGFPQPPMPPPSWPLPLPPPPPKLPVTKLSCPPNPSPCSPASSSSTPALLSSASTAHTPQAHAPLRCDSPDSVASHLKNKKSVVRLSAVGFINAPLPWWGDDD